MNRAPVLAAEGIGKTFPGVRALYDVDFDVRPGEIHALLGQNGAGKSTLMNILAGVVEHDSGRLLVNGAPVRIQQPIDAQALGISIVHQELSLFPSRSVAENIFVGRLPKAHGFVDLRALLEQTRVALSEMEIDIDPRALVRDLPFPQQQLIEIAKALSFGGRVLILDEPTSALTEHECAILFRRLRLLRETGMAIIYVSHRLREVFALSDRITILRDGRLVGTFSTGTTTPADVISMMVNRNIATVGRPGTTAVGGVDSLFEGYASARQCTASILTCAPARSSGWPVLRAPDNPRSGGPSAASFHAAPNSISLDGLSSAGARREMRCVRASFTCLPIAEPKACSSDSTSNRTSSPPRLTSCAVGRGWRRRGSGSRCQLRRIALPIRTPSLWQRVVNLSGGNQQKVVLARGLTVDARVFIADEPTRGIDVGAKVEIYALLRKLAAAGRSILLISTELPELLAMSDRIRDRRWRAACRRAERGRSNRRADHGACVNPFGDSKSRKGRGLSVKTTSVSASDSDVNRPPGGLIKRLLQVREMTLLVLVVGCAAIFSLVVPHFGSAANALSIADTLVFDAIITTGMTIALVAGGFDLSVGSVFASSGVVVAVAMASGMPVWLADHHGAPNGCGLGSTQWLRHHENWRQSAADDSRHHGYGARLRLYSN